MLIQIFNYEKILFIKIFILGFVSLNAQNINTEMEKVSYSLGVNIASSLKQQGWELDAKSHYQMLLLMFLTGINY